MKTRAWWLVALALVPSSALAEEVAGASPRSFLFEARVAPYTPNIDAAFGADGPYKKIFGGTFMWLGEAELDVQFFQRFGSLAFGLSAGYAEKYGKALVANSDVSSSQSTSLHMVPIKALLVYRFDWLNLKLGVPLVPYLKGGPMIIPWWVDKGSSLEVISGASGDVRAIGYKLGLAGVVGLAVSLDFLDRRMARDFDSSVGVNHSYLFAECTLQDTLLFEPDSNPSPLNLSGLYPVFGLGLEF